MVIGEMRDGGNKYPDVTATTPQSRQNFGSQDYIESLGELKNMEEQKFYSLNPRFLKMDNKTRKLLLEIADTPSREKDQTEALLEQMSKIISGCKDSLLKERLEWEMDAAATAHVLGKPNNYYNSI